MKLYRILLPTVTNQGASYAAALDDFENRALAVAAGYTKLATVDGVWIGADDFPFRDVMQPYEVCCTPDNWTELVAFAKRAFHDQVALFIAELGEASLV